MGMFDSLMIEIDHHPVELQTKCFDNILGYYYPGDSIAGAPSGIHVYFDLIDLDNNGKQVYNESNSVRSYTVFIVLAHGIFTTYTIKTGKLDNTSIEDKLNKLRKHWSDSGLLLLTWLDFLKNKQSTISVLNQKIHRAQSVIDDARKLQAGEDITSKHLFFTSNENKRLREGEDPLDVIESVLKNADPELFLDLDTTDNPLEQYRL